MSGPLVSVVIPAFNSGAFVTEAIESVLGQTYENVECIVVDDGSTDDTQERVAAFDEHVVSFRQVNAGVSAARNRGIELATGDYIAFLDADDIYLPRKIERQLKLFDQRPELGAVYTGLHLVGSDRRFHGREEPPPGERALMNTLLLERPIMTIVTAVIPRAVIADIGGFDEGLSTSADCDFGCRIALRYPVEPVPEPLMLYRKHAGQMHNDPVATERDMRVIFERFLSDPGFRQYRKRAYANLYVSLAGSYLRLGDKRRFARYASRAFFLRPDRVLDAIRRLASPRGGVTRAY